MFRHYLIIALRNIRKYALQNTVSIIGLAAGFVAYAFSSLWIGYVNSYDSYHKDSDRIYTFAFNEDGRTTIGNERTRGNGDLFYLLFRNFAASGKLDSLGIESILYYDVEGGDDYWSGPRPTCLCIDTAFIDFFNPILVDGDWSFLDDLGKIAVSRSYASKEFGDENPIGKEITQGSSQYTVCAVIDDFDHSFIKFDMIKKWNGYSMYYYKWLFFKLQEGVTVQDMLDKSEGGFYLMLNESMDNAMRYKSIIPLKEVYKNQDEAEAETFVRYNGLELISKASLLILLCAIVNHFTFFLNYLRGRRREMSLRKVNGASTGKIAAQMAIESSIPVLLSLLLGLVAVLMLKEPFMRLADIGMADSYYWRGSLLIMTAVLVVSVLIGLVEVSVISRNTLQSSIIQGNDRIFRRVSIGIQIASGMALMFALIVMNHQFSYMLNLNWGTQRKDVAFVSFPQEKPETEKLSNGLFRYIGERPMWGDEYLEVLENKHGLKEMISSLPCVTGVYMNFADMSVKHSGEAAFVSATGIFEDPLFPDVFDYIYPELIDRLGLSVLEGAIPQEGLKDNEIVITDNLLKALGGTSLKDMPVLYIRLGESGMEMTPFNVVAVVKNIHLYNYDDIPPLILLCGFRKKYLIDEYSYGSDRGSGPTSGELSVQLMPNTKKEFESSLKEMMNGLGIDYKVENPEESFFKHLSKDRNLTEMLLILCLISIAIALFGVYSQISLTCTERSREIAIRKAHGAKVKDILSIFAREYGTIFIVSSVLALILGYLVMHRWIQQFYYQATISWWIYVVLFAFTAAAIVCTVISRILKAARENPAEVIKSE